MTVDFGRTAEVQPAEGKDVQPVSTSVVRRGWGSSVFGIVAEGHARRRPSDIARVVVALVVIAIASAGATEVTTIESAVFDLIASLPGGLEPLWNVLYFLAPIVAGALLVTALVARRPAPVAARLDQLRCVVHRRDGARAGRDGRDRDRADRRVHRLGDPRGSAVAATFTARLRTSYLPPIWGWFALSWLRKKDYV